MAVLTISGVAVPCPSSMSWELETWDSDSSRSAITGEMCRTVICHKQKLEVEWNCANLSTEQISQILKLLLQDFFTVKFFSPLEGKEVTLTMYVGNRNIDFYRVIDGVPQYLTMSFSLIEK